MRDRVIVLATRFIGRPRIDFARRVLDRFGAAEGELLAAGIAYNAVLALVPVGIFATGVAGFLLTDAASRTKMIASIADFLPPLAGVVDEIVGGLSRASPSLSIIGLLLAGWGTSRLFAALESAIAQLDGGDATARRSLAHRTIRRIASIVVLTVIVLAALVAAPTLAVAVEISGGGPARPVLDVLLAFLPPVLAAAALGAVYRLIPLRRPTWRAIGPPAIVGALVLVAVTRFFVFVAPRVFGANLVYGALGALLIGLTWLDLVFTIVLLGASWVRERMPTDGVAVA